MYFLEWSLAAKLVTAQVILVNPGNLHSSKFTHYAVCNLKYSWQGQGRKTLLPVSLISNWRKDGLVSLFRFLKKMKQ